MAKRQSSSTRDETVEEAAAAEQIAEETVPPVNGVAHTNGAAVAEAAVADVAVDGHTTVMFLGSGEHARELAVSFQRLGAHVIVVDSQDGPAHGVAHRTVAAALDDAERVAEIVRQEKPQFVVPLAETVAVEVLDALENTEAATQVIPTPKAARLGRDREAIRRMAAEELGLPTPAYGFADSADDLRRVVEELGYPAVVRPVSASCGQGQAVVLREVDVEPAWEQAVGANVDGRERVLVETVVEIDYEILLLTVRTPGVGGATRLFFCEPIAHRQSGADALQAWQPQPLSQAAIELARSIAARVVNALGGYGIYGVELFVHGDDVYFSDLTSRPDDAGLVTVRSQRLSQFDLHARAVLGLSVDTILVSPAAAELVYGDGDVPTRRRLDEALRVPESDVRVFGHSETHRRRRVGMGLATAPNAAVALGRAHHVAGQLR